MEGSRDVCRTLLMIRLTGAIIFTSEEVVQTRGAAWMTVICTPSIILVSKIFKERKQGRRDRGRGCRQICMNIQSVDIHGGHRTRVQTDHVIGPNKRHSYGTSDGAHAPRRTLHCDDRSVQDANAAHAV